MKGGISVEKKEPVTRKEVLRAMMDLAKGAANDTVKLAYLEGEDRDVIDSLDLGCLTEFKRSGNGTIELKLTDRADILAELMKLLEEERREKQRQKQEEKQGPAAFLQALEDRTAPEKEPG